MIPSPVVVAVLARLVVAALSQIVVALPVVVVPVTILLPIVRLGRLEVVWTEDLDAVQGHDGARHAVIVDVEKEGARRRPGYEIESEDVWRAGRSGERLRSEDRDRARSRHRGCEKAEHDDDTERAEQSELPARIVDHP